MRAGRRVAVLVALALAAGALAGCGGDDSLAKATALRRQSAGAKLKVAGPKDGKAAGNVVDLKLSGAGVAIVEPEGDTSGKTGHYVVFVDRDPVPFGRKIPDEPGVIESEKATVRVAGLRSGSHEATVVLADGAGRRIGRKSASTTFSVTAPTLVATAPDKTKAKQPVTVEVTVEGVTIVAAPPPAAPAATGSTTPPSTAPAAPAAGPTGHFAVFVDRDPTDAGMAVPTQRGIMKTADNPIALPDLGHGEHELWIVLVKADDTPFDPMVAAKVDVEVD